MRSSGLTTTSFALLALLAVRSWSTYELAKQMDRSLRWFWPRAASVLYTEPKKLVEHGLAEAAQEYTGGRPRTVYTITPRGREALRAWLDQPGSGPQLEFGALLQVAFADCGSKEQLLRILAAIRAQAEAQRQEALERVREYSETGGPFPDRLPIIALTGKFLLEQTDLIARWAAWAEQEVATWSGVTPREDARAPADAFRLTFFRPTEE